jgi:hypothetical protein
MAEMTPDRVLAALRKKPLLLYKMVAKLLGVKIASPWIHKPHETYRHRQTPAGKKLARVQRHRTRKMNPWEAMVVNPNGDKPRKNFQQESLAVRWCDEQLIALGYMLAETPDV